MEYDIITGEGNTIGTVTYNASDVFYCAISVDIHTSHSTKEQAIIDLYGEMLLSGAGQYNRAEFLDAVNRLGASINIDCASGQCKFTLRAQSRHTKKLLELFSIMMREPLFTASELKRARTLTHNSLVEAEEDAREVALENLRNALFGVHDRRYTDSPKSERAVLPEITKKDLVAFHGQLLNTEWTIVIGGPATTVRTAVKALQAVHASALPTKERVHEPILLPQQHLRLQSIPSKQNIEFSIGGALPLTLDHEHMAPFMFGLSVLAKWGGFTGRLMSTVREKEGLTYSIYGRPETVSRVESGYWRIMTFFAPEKTLEGITSTMREIKAMHERGITDHELERFKVILKTGQALENDNFTRSIEHFLFYLKNGYTLASMHEHRASLLAVDKRSVNQAMRTYLDPAQLVISGAGPVKGVEKELKKFLEQ